MNESSFQKLSSNWRYSRRDLQRHFSRSNERLKRTVQVTSGQPATTSFKWQTRWGRRRRPFVEERSEIISLIRFISTNYWRIVPVYYRINLHGFSTKQIQWTGVRRLFFVGQQDTSRKCKIDWKHYSAIPSSSCSGLCSRLVEIFEISRSLEARRQRTRGISLSCQWFD